MNKRYLGKCSVLVYWLLLSVSLHGFAQVEMERYVIDASVKIRSVNPDSADYSDLEPMGDAIGDARIVMLGEQDHGDAAAFLAKTRLVKYLHERKGFDVLAFESDFFSLNYYWRRGDADLSIGYPLALGITHLWSLCKDCKHLFEAYIPANYHRVPSLELAGFDAQMNTAAMIPLLDSVVRAASLPIAETQAYRLETLPLLKSWYAITSQSKIDTCILYCQQIKDQLKTACVNGFWIIVMDNMICNLKMLAVGSRDHYGQLNLRDEQMARNLEWLVRIKYPDKKIIVWAHNGHIAKHAGFYPVKYMNRWRSMGSVFAEMSGNDELVYTIGFTSYQGTAGRLGEKPYKLPQPLSNSFENWMPALYENAFVDFRPFNRMHPNWQKYFIMAGATSGNNRYHHGYKARWNRIFDGVFFIRHMHPCTGIDKQ